MEFTNEIFFNKPLMAESTVIITYSGKLYREHSKDVSIVFGYGEDWKETDNAPMVETETGFEVTLTIKNYNTFNFCFTNSFNIWDNNEGHNYIATIEEKKEIPDAPEEIHLEEVDQQEDAHPEAIDETPDNDSIEESSADASSPTEEIEEEVTEESNQVEDSAEDTNTSEKFENVEEPKEDIEKAFASLLDSLIDNPSHTEEDIDISNLSGFGLQSVDEIKEEEVVNCDKIFSEFFEELTTEEETNLGSANYDNADAQELDSLMDNLLLSISDTTKNTELDTPIEAIENSALPVPVQKDDWLDRFLDVSYQFSQKVSNAFKKLGSLIKLKAKELGILNNDK